MKKKTPKDRYIYPAVFSYKEGEEISVEFPDLNCATSGVDEEDALLSARELLGLVLWSMEEDGEEIPPASSLAALKASKNERIALIDVYMPAFRLAGRNRAVNRTVTLPAWLNAAAMAAGVNFSQVLQEALKELLRLPQS